MKRILFVLKYREGYTGPYAGTPREMSSGLLNSARFIVDMLIESGVECRLVQVVDNNEIDRHVHHYKPTDVIIEAFWVVPEKFEILQKLHPKVRWIVRIHSEVPFFAGEGIAVDWICRYVKYKKVVVSANSESAAEDIRTIVAAANPTWWEEKLQEKVPLLPNYYPFTVLHQNKKGTDILDVACFGAIRPLKNQLIQAVAAIQYAKFTGKYLRFHINATRIEQHGNENIKNIRSLFFHTRNAELIEHEWAPHDKFMKLLTHMDLGMQVSLTETFNIVAADMVCAGLPIVVSPEIKWATKASKANPTDTIDIINKMISVMDWPNRPLIKYLNHRGLKHYCENSKKLWLAYFK